MRLPFSVRSFFTDAETKDIGRGIVLWRGYFQSVRPAIGRMLINVDVSTGAMYKPGPLIDLALAFLGRPGNPNALAPNQGLSEWERIRLQGFIMGLKVTTSHGQLDQGHQIPRQRVVRKLSSEGASSLEFELANGPRMTVANYFRGKLNRPLLFPDVICVEVCASPQPVLRIAQFPTAFNGRLDPTGALRCSPRSDNARTGTLGQDKRPA
jgi:eukaryotic translation initiation factor 2C